MVFKSIQDDIGSFMDRDPAARSRWEVVICYPGFHALAVYRLSSALWRRKLYLLARFVSHIGRLLTGIEIHPGAVIGERLFIDHGFGVVIGETSEIGNDVTLYQGVTLGGLAPSVDSRAQINVKRHPTLQDGVIVGSGAQLLGPITIGRAARVGANAVVTRDVPPGVTAVGIPARAVMPRDRSTAAQFVAYGTPAEGCPDPILASLENMRGQLTALQERVSELEGELGRSEENGQRQGPASGEFGDEAAALAPIRDQGRR